MVIARASLAPSFLYNKKFRNFLLALFTFFLVNVTWVFFRATDFSTAWRLLGAMFGQVENGIPVLPTIDMIKVVTVVTGMVTVHWLMRNTAVLKVAQQQKWWVVGMAWALMVILLCLSQKSSDSFIYFQF